MLALSPLRSNNEGNINKKEDTTMDVHFSIGGDDFPDFSGGNLLDSIDFDDLFMGMQEEGDVLPDLEMDPELLAEFSLSGGEDSDANNSSSLENINPNQDTKVPLIEEVVRKSSSEEEIQSKKEPDLESESTTTVSSSSVKDCGKAKKYTSLHKSQCNNANNNSSNNGKRKTKVDWTPELHRRFVQAVEQLGVDKAVPSRILELMGIDCLTRHNIASHLQKYRSHRKHLLAREAEAASWTQKRQMYGVAVGGGGGKGGGANTSPWHPPTMGFPPMATMHHHPSFRPLHVWGHPSPTMDLQARVPMPLWPKKMGPPGWTPPTDPSFWHSHHQRVPPAAPCFPHPRPLQQTRFTTPSVAVPGIPPHAIYRPEHGGVTPAQPGFEAHPSKESIDAAIGDVLTKPWQPLPIGLKPPSIDSVLVELQRQGVPKIPPSCA